jgi:hypothetical protein
VSDRVRRFSAAGFIAFYSTLPSAGLADNLTAFRTQGTEVQVFDARRIEELLLRHPTGLSLARRYMPISAAVWAAEHPTPAPIFHPTPALECAFCGRNLLAPEPSGIVVFWYKLDHATGARHNAEIYACCQGTCDSRLQPSRHALGLSDGWEQIDDICIPQVFCKWLVGPLNQLRGGDSYSDGAFEALKHIILSLYPHIARHPTTAESQRVRLLKAIPPLFGGL